MPRTGWRCARCGALDNETITLYRPERAFFNAMVRAFDPTCGMCGGPATFDAGTDGLASPTGRVLVVSGTCASGKTTVSDVLAEQHGFVQLDADWFLAKRKDELGRHIDFNEVHEEMLTMAEGLVHLGRDVVIAHVVLPEWVAMYERFFGERGIAYRVVILMPQMKVILQRNEERVCWWTEHGIIERFQDALLAGDDHVRGLFYDNGGETAEETARRMAQGI